jgi:hypothetical protein
LRKLLSFAMKPRLRSQVLDNETGYRALFNRFARPDDKFDEEWAFQDAVIEQGQVVGTHSWESDNPGAGAGMTLIYRSKGLFFTSTDFGLDGPYEEFSQAAEAVNLLTVTPTTERIWVDYKTHSNSKACDDDRIGILNNFIN